MERGHGELPPFAHPRHHLARHSIPVAGARAEADDGLHAIVRYLPRTRIARSGEALAIYRRHVKSGGIIAFHVTNRYLDLVPVVQELADAAGLHAVLVADDGEEPMGSRSAWVLLSDSETRLEAEPIEEAEEAIEP